MKNSKGNYITKEGLEELKKELDYLETVKRKEIAERLKHTASFGDLSENAAYQEAKEGQAFLEGKISELKALIANALIIEKKSQGIAALGSTVQITSDLKSKKPKVETFKIVGSAEANPLEGKISADSPLGKSLMNKKEGATFFIETPNGKAKHKIVKIF